jgi:hypothetical protein
LQEKKSEVRRMLWHRREEVEFEDVEHSEKELKRIEELKKEGEYICINRKGHLCFWQMHPNFSIYVSACAIVIDVIALLIMLLKHMQ